MEQKKTAIIAGGGPAGLTGAWEFLKTSDIHPVVFEEEGQVGGISKTIEYHGNRMDIGGHRFFSKNDTVMDWWQKMMPLEANAATSDTDRVMLLRRRVSRILFHRHFFDYPISMKWSTFAGMGLWRSLKAGFGYLWATIFKKKEDSLENFYINRFGRPLYEMFFEDYTEKVWGIHPGNIGADWGAQRVKGLSIRTLLKDIITKPFRKKGGIGQKNVETSLIEQFIYPKYGPGQLWETVGREVRDMGGEIHNFEKVTGVHVTDGHVTAVDVTSCAEGNAAAGSTRTVPCDYFLSSMPLRDLIAMIKDTQVPEDVKAVADNLPYRDFITVGLLVKKLKLGRIPDTWIYVQEPDVKVGRLQIFNNWSPYMVADEKGSMFIGLEYFCNEGDALWTMSDDDFISMAISEMEKIGVLDPSDVLDSTRVKIRKAYPAYFGSYSQIDKVRGWIDTIDNLWCIGRNGQHRYNNMDHSMLTAIQAVRSIKNGSTDKSPVWSVNTEEEYHESK